MNLGEDTFRLATGESLGVLGCATADIWLPFTATKKGRIEFICGLNISFRKNDIFQDPVGIVIPVVKCQTSEEI